MTDSTNSKVTCTKCKKDVTEAAQCDRCDVKYCSNSCMNLHWKTHKKGCSRSRFAPQTAPSSSQFSGPPRALEKPVDPGRGWNRLGKGTWFHGRPERDVYKLLIDAHRLWMDDRYDIANVREPGSLYAPGATDGMEAFRTFLDKAENAEQREGVPVLPAWWNKEKRDECEALGADTTQWSSLTKKASKEAIQKHYDDIALTMQLRSVCESIYDRLVDGRRIAPIPDHFLEQDSDDYYDDFDEHYDDSDEHYDDSDDWYTDSDDN